MPGTKTAAGGIARQPPFHPQCDQRRAATTWCLPLPPQSGPESQPDPASEGDEHFGCFAEAEIADPAPHIRGQLFHDLLKSEGLTSSTGKPFTLSMIRWIRHKHHIPSPLPPAGTLTVGQVRQRYGVSLWVVHYWIERGIVLAVHRKRNTPYAITINVDVDRRLREWVANSGHLRRVPPNAN